MRVLRPSDADRDAANEALLLDVVSGDGVSEEEGSVMVSKAKVRGTRVTGKVPVADLGPPIPPVQFTPQTISVRFTAPQRIGGKMVEEIRAADGWRFELRGGRVVVWLPSENRQWDLPTSLCVLEQVRSPAERPDSDYAINLGPRGGER